MNGVLVFEKSGEIRAVKSDGIAEEDVICSEINSITTMEVLLYPDFEAWGFPEKTTTLVTLISDATRKIEFFGRVSSVTKSMDEQGLFCERVKCESEAAFLKDTVAEPSYLASGTMVSSAVSALIAAHNAKADQTRQFRVGRIQGGALQNALQLDYGSTFDSVKKIIEAMKWELRTRHGNGVSYLDAAETFGTESSTPMIIGDNLKNITYSEASAVNQITRLIPLGGVGYDGNRLTIEHVAPNGENYIDNAELVSEYGVYEGILQINELSLEDESLREEAERQLYEIGRQEAAALGERPKKVVLSAADLEKMGYADYEGFMLGNRHPVICPQLRIHELLRISGIKRRMANEHLAELTIATANTSRVYTAVSPRLSSRISEYNVYYSSLVTSVDKKQTSMTDKKLDKRLDKLSFKKLTPEEYAVMKDAGELDGNTRYTTVDEETGEIKEYLGEEPYSKGGGGGDDGIPYPGEMIFLAEGCFGFAGEAAADSMTAASSWVEGGWTLRSVTVDGETKQIVDTSTTKTYQRTGPVTIDRNYLYLVAESDQTSTTTYNGYCVDSGGYYLGMLGNKTYALRDNGLLKSAGHWVRYLTLPAGTAAIYFYSTKSSGAAARDDIVYFLR